MTTLRLGAALTERRGGRVSMRLAERAINASWPDHRVAAKELHLLRCHNRDIWKITWFLDYGILI